MWELWTTEIEANGNGGRAVEVYAKRIDAFARERSDRMLDSRPCSLSPNIIVKQESPNAARVGVLHPSVQ